MSKLKVELVEDNDGFDYGQSLIVTHDGIEIARESDGGEPEDQSFYRDWNWVPGLIERVYSLGVADGIKIGRGVTE